MGVGAVGRESLVTIATFGGGCGVYRVLFGIIRGGGMEGAPASAGNDKDDENDHDEEAADGYAGHGGSHGSFGHLGGLDWKELAMSEINWVELRDMRTDGCGDQVLEDSP
jgi:hypothetical protein